MSDLLELLYGGGDDTAGKFDWMEQGLCAQTDPELFFPEKGGSVREAKKVCMACPVRQECLAWALETGERYGIWGGLTERERRKLRNAPAAAEAA